MSSPRPLKRDQHLSWGDLVSRAERASVKVSEIVHDTDKALVAIGTRCGHRVVVKLLTSRDPYWISRRDHELDMYSRFEVDPPGVDVPRLLWADQQLTVLTALPGQRLYHERHLTHDIPPAQAELVADTVQQVTRWAPRHPLPEPVDYHQRIDDEHAAQLLDDRDQATLHTLVDRAGPARTSQHGDPLPANLLIHDRGCGLIDWEHAGAYLPGYDLALLRVIATVASPTLTRVIARRVAAADITVPHTVNYLLLVCREIRIHLSLPPGAVIAARLPLLRTLHVQAHRELHALTS
ncbi:phosphotransferase [Micromonospora aurantiaca (nom. illeg.)]|uniref:phosphotransferase n=1 Tax=Micromonospora aurantiaca (nom. illeg.) TaxID=47850 RepID=UPI000827540B|nr:phosphotransferase [Micromonospora aurantiaca]SCL36022.1 Phosphotransferase enzyme family protein [Micromonospora aurantiaca]